MKKLYVIPGLGESTKQPEYQTVMQAAKSAGLEVVPVDIRWEIDMTMTDFIDQVDYLVPQNSSESYILGFSFGAYIAAVLSSKKEAGGYIFCSLSPYFSDDIEHIPQESKEYFGTEMMNNFEQYSFPEGVNAQAWFLVGEDDWTLAIQRSQKAHDVWGGKKELILIEGAGHDLGNTNYANALQNIIKKL